MLNFNLNKVLAALLTTVALIAGQQAWAETVTYKISGTTEQNGDVNFTATASGSVSGTVSDR